MNPVFKHGAQVFLASALFGCVSVACAMQQDKTPGQNRCTRDQAIKAETESSTLNTWEKIFSSYSRYKQCDDGAIRETLNKSAFALSY